MTDHNQWDAYKLRQQQLREELVPVMQRWNTLLTLRLGNVVLPTSTQYICCTGLYWQIQAPEKVFHFSKYHFFGMVICVVGLVLVRAHFLLEYVFHNMMHETVGRHMHIEHELDIEEPLILKSWELHTNGSKDLQTMFDWCVLFLQFVWVVLFLIVELHSVYPY